MQHPGDAGAPTADCPRLLPRLGKQEQPGHLVLVLVGHQLVQVALYRFRQFGVVERGDAVGDGSKPSGVLRRLVAGEVGNQALAQGALVGGRGDAGGFLCS